MPRTSPHVMVRGIERKAIVRDDADRVDFVGRLAALAEARALDRSPWAGHSALLGQVARDWQDTQSILAQFGPTPRRARAAAAAWAQVLGRC